MAFAPVKRSIPENSPPPPAEQRRDVSEAEERAITREVLRLLAELRPLKVEDGRIVVPDGTSEEIAATVQAYVDGACHPNPGRGGWGAVLQCGGREKWISDSIESITTNQRAEVTAAIQALRALKVPARVEILSDSEYLTRSMRGEYRRRTNLALWAEIDAVAEPHEVVWTWIPGHAGDRGNEIAHRLAERAAGGARRE